MTKRVSPIPIDRFPASAAPVVRVTATCCPRMAGMQRYWSSLGPVTAQAVNRSGGAVDPIVSCPTTFGFDNRTNLPKPDDRGTKEYWNRPGGPGTSGGRRDLDGSTWVCVGVGGTAELEVRFVGHSGVACIKNVSIAVDDASKVTVTPLRFAAQSVRLAIQGVAAGECTITVRCNGAPIGWCHAAVYRPARGLVTLKRVVLMSGTGSNARSLTWSVPITGWRAGTIKQGLDLVYGQCAVSWDVMVGPSIVYSTPRSVSYFNASVGQGKFPSAAGYKQFLMDIMAADRAPSAAPVIDLFYLTPPDRSRIGGAAVGGIGSYQSILFTDATPDDVLPHEVGHNLGLYHPDQAPARQLPDNFRLPMVGTSRIAARTMFSDHINLMGYAASTAPDAALRYGQWKEIRSRIT